jgi:hypothetical protein
MANEPRDTFKYHFKVGNVIVHRGITNNLSVREASHQRSGRYTMHNGQRLYWLGGHIVKIGIATTHDEALRWERGQHNQFGGT